ncbi:hypothetical protein RFI_25167 [Reticulomyxa filosa]|uniref:Uncharacterized protein n=1 Tax=Reticulomyxa filosa TaxID=46433 RepID=X6MFK7_RETFI|nr:hypothetical protein RFI_25167 [Reticulomyxa filosa]|eukprot:ETO12207.1 hypothetical protein RFI_25167 [Reticulomyxa filosa]
MQKWFLQSECCPSVVALNVSSSMELCQQVVAFAPPRPKILVAVFFPAVFNFEFCFFERARANKNVFIVYVYPKKKKIFGRFEIMNGKDVRHPIHKQHLKKCMWVVNADESKRWLFLSHVNEDWICTFFSPITFIFCLQNVVKQQIYFLTDITCVQILR